MANKKIESLTEIKEAVAATSAVAETKRKPSRDKQGRSYACLLYTSPSPRDRV